MNDLRAVYEALVLAPLREGRLRLEGLPGAERQLARFGVVALAGVLASLVLGDLWRRDELIPVATVGRYHAVPEALLPATLIALLVAWAVFLWGATLASNWVTAIAGVLFLSLNATIAKPQIVELADSPSVLGWGPDVTRVAYFAVPGVMVVYSLVALRKDWEPRGRVPMLAALLVSLTAFFGSLYAIHLAEIREGLSLTIPTLLDASFEALRSAFVPVLALAAIAVVEFGYTVSGAAVTPLLRRGALVAKVAVAILIAVKLCVQIVRHDAWLPASDDWGRTILSIAYALVLFAAFWLLVRGRPPSQEAGEVKDRLALGGALVYSSPVLVVLLVATLTIFFIVQLDWLGASDLLEKFPTGWVGDHGPVVSWTLTLLVSLGMILHARRRHVHSEFGLALLLLALWALPTPVLDELGERRAFNVPLFDLVVTAGLAFWLALRWRRIDAVAAAQLGAIVIFAWLLSTRFDLLYTAFGHLGLPAIALVVLGILFSLLGGSAFAQGESKRFPQRARALLWIGYLLLSLTLLNWTELTHAGDLDFSTGVTENGFFLIGIPLAVWLVLYRARRAGAVSASTER